MPSNYTRRISLYINGKEVKNDIASIKAEMNKLVGQQARMTIGSKEYVAATKNIKQLKGILADHNEQLRVTSGGWAGMKKAADGFNKYFTMATAGIAAFTGLAMSIGGLLSSNSKLSDSMADVAKSTGLSMTEVKELNTELRKIDTRTSREELLNLAYVAGKLGYSAQNDVLGFVKAADQIGVALSKDLGGNVEDAVNSLGKIADVFKVKDQFGIEQALLKTGSAINALGAASTANEAYIVDFTKRLGGIAPQAGISVQNIMGLAATLDQLGQQTETSATAVGQLLVKMNAKPGDFAKIAGKSVGEFTTLLKKDANEALILFLQGLQKNKGGLQELATKFSDLGVDGTRSIGVIGALANNIDILTSSQKLSNVEFENGTSLTNEFNIKNENMASNLEKVKRALLSAFVNSSIMDGLDSIVKAVASWFEIPLSKKLEDERIKVNMLASEMLDANTPLATRNKLYTELKGLAPQVVEGIDQENISLDKLRGNLEKYNEQMINKIIIQKQQQVIDKANEKVAAHREDRLKQEAEVRKVLAITYSEARKYDKSAAGDINKINTDPKLTLIQKADAIQNYLLKSKKNLGSPQSIVGKTNVLKIYAEEEAAAQLKVNEALKEKNKLYSDLGMNVSTAGTTPTATTITPTTTITDPPTGGGGNGGGTSSDTKAKALKAAEEAYKQVQDIKKREIESGLALMKDGYDKELLQLNAKYMAEREAIVKELQTNKTLTLAEKDSLNQTIANMDQEQLDNIAKLDQKKAMDQLKMNKDLIDLQLEGVREGSAEEYQLKKQQLDAQQQIELAEVKGTEEEKGKFVAAIRAKYARMQAAEDEKFALQFIDDKLKQDITALQASETKKEEQLRKARDDGKISQRKYQKELIQLQHEYKIESLKIALDKAARELEIRQKAGEDVIDQQKELAAIQLELEKEQANGGKPDANNPIEKKGFEDMSGKEIRDYAIDQAQSVADTIFQIKKDKNQQALDDTLKKLEEERNAELSNKNLTERQKDAINAEYDAKAKKLKQAAWKKQHKMDLLQAIAGAALGVIKAIPNIPLMIAAAIAGGLGVATIASQKMPEFSEGGFTATDSSNKKPAGIVHANEYVVPEQGVNNPELQPILNAFEVARQSGNLPRLNSRTILKSMGKGFAKGGSTSELDFMNNNLNARSNGVADERDSMLLKAVNVIEKLSERLDSPIEASVAIRGRNGLYEKMEEDKQSQKNGSI